MSAHEGFPKFYSHPTKPNRVAHTPTDEVNLLSYGYKENTTKAAEKTLAKVEDANKQAEANANGASDQTDTQANTGQTAKKAAAAPRS